MDRRWPTGATVFTATAPDGAELRAGDEVAALAGGQVVQHPHGMAGGTQRLAQMGADETASAGDEISLHFWNPETDG